ncbi:MAG: hypothetical protein LBT84_05475 [Spirochaetia bacterium]|jgi:hypothetical protein|nr:hypothetical protein [Spirochaetia bacterium]
MNLLDRYKNGETKEVYAEILNLEQNAFIPPKITEIEDVLTETFKRAAFNLQIIHDELVKIGYAFWDRPLHKPLPNTDKLLKQLDAAVLPFGYVPLSLKYFYKIAGGVDFAWNYEANKKFLWEMADPIQIYSLDELVDYVDTDWKDDMQDSVNSGEDACLELSADDLHKDNASGGTPYSLKITATPSIDSDFLFEYHETTFIDYLRICFEFCGFPGNPQNSKSFTDFVSSVKPKLMQI